MKDSFDVMREAVKAANKLHIDLAVFIVRYGDLMGAGYTSDEAVEYVFRELKGW